jgi:hypothetical protein
LYASYRHVQVPVLAVLFFLLGCGNIYTTMTTWHRKLFAMRPTPPQHQHPPT